MAPAKVKSILLVPRRSATRFSIGREVAPIYGRIRAYLRRSGQPIGALDLLIAAHALYLGAVLVTNDVADFSRVPHLQIENWSKA